MSKGVIVLIIVGFLSGCATPADQAAMSLDATERSNYSTQSDLAGQVAVGSVIGGEETNPAWTSEIGSIDFKNALENSLETAFLLGQRMDSEYLVDVELIEINQPVFGFTFNVSSQIKYTLRDRRSREIVFDEIIRSDGSASAGDAFMGVKRLRIATENSAKNNIRKFIDRLLEFTANSSTTD